ncbi:MAG: NAD-dependent epimerase/dehydratase family protein [Acidimicrobiales bacterium]
MLDRLLADPAIEVVRSVARRSLPPHPKLRHTRADLASYEAVRALAGVEVLWHLGFALWRGPGALEANRGGIRTVLASRPGRVVLASSAAVYGAWPDNACPLGEGHATRPNRECPYAEQKLDAERALAGELPAAVLRICAVLGPHIDPRVGRVTQGYRLMVPAIRGAHQMLQFLHEDDAADALHLAGKAGFRGVCNVSPPDWLDARGIAEAAGSRVVALPRTVLFRLAEVGRRVGASPFGVDRAVLLSGPLALDPSLAHQELGWRAQAGSAEVLAGALGQPGSPWLHADGNTRVGPPMVG